MGMRYYPQTTQEKLHHENQPRNVVLFAGDVGLNTYASAAAPAALNLLAQVSLRRNAPVGALSFPVLAND